MKEKRDINAERRARLQIEIEQAKHKAKIRTGWRSLMDELIDEGQEKGLFDDLRGKGAPLALDKNPFEADKELAHSLLKENETPPAWIGERRALLDHIAALRETIRRQWAWHQREYAAAALGEHGRLTISWDNYIQRWQAEIGELNKRIDDYNLKRPLENMEIFKLSLDHELKRADAPRWLR